MTQTRSDHLWTALVLLAAILARCGYLGYNLALDLPPVWKYDARVALAAGNALAGAIGEGAASAERMSVLIRDWMALDRGTGYLHALFAMLFGRSEYLHLQLANLVVDVLMVPAVMAQAKRMGGRRTARTAGLIYALYLPQIYLVAQPSYDCWLTFGFILTTGLFLDLWERLREGGPLPLGRLLLLTLTLAAANQFRSVIVVYGLAMAGWVWLVETVARPAGILSPARLRMAGAFAAAAALGIGLSMAGNWIVRGEGSAVRSTFGHSFWAGVGQFENPYGVISDDGSVVAFYSRETGIADTENTMGRAYNDWLKSKAAEFIRTHPGLYLSQVARRALMVVFIDDGMYWVADQPSLHENHAAQEQDRRDRRLAILARDGHTPLALIHLAAADPEYALRLVLRLLVTASFPLGVALALVRLPDRRRTALACLPLAYGLVTIAPFYGPLLVDTSYYGALIPVLAAGWLGPGKARRP